MVRSFLHRPRGFSRLDLLVVVGVITITLLCAVPALPTARERGRQTVCSNNLRNVANALLTYEISHNQYPGYLNPLVLDDGTLLVDFKTGQRSGVSFVVPILPQLDRPDLLHVWKTPAGAHPNARSAGSHAMDPVAVRLHSQLDVLCCPNDPATTVDSWLSFVANCGMADWAGSPAKPRDWEDNGVFFDQFTGDPRVAGPSGEIPRLTMSNHYIKQHDGLQNTILMTENVNAGNYTDTSEAALGVVWNGRGTIDTSKSPPHLDPIDPAMKMNHEFGDFDSNGLGRVARLKPPIVYARPSSYHPQGVNVAFCDGHLRFVSDQIDYFVYCLLMSTNGKNVREPGADVVLPEFGWRMNDGWVVDGGYVTPPIGRGYFWSFLVSVVVVVATYVALSLYSHGPRKGTD